MTTFEKVAYLKGLADGLELGKETKEQKLLAAIIEVLDAVAEDLDILEETVIDMGEELDAISEDLSDVEEVVFDEDCCCDYDDCCCGDDDDCCCGHDHDGDHEGCCHGEGEGHGDHEGCCHGGGQGHKHGGHGGGCCGGHHGAMYEVTCPACNNTITIDEEVLALGSIECPSCGGKLEFDLDGEEA